MWRCVEGCGVCGGVGRCVVCGVWGGMCGGVGRSGEVCGGGGRSGETEHTHQDIVEEEKLSAL